MMQTEKKQPPEQTGTEAQEQGPEVGPESQPDDDMEDGASPEGRP